MKYLLRAALFAAVLTLIVWGCREVAIVEYGVRMNIQCRVTSSLGRPVPNARLELHDRRADRLFREHRAFVCVTDKAGSCSAEVAYRFHRTKKAGSSSPRSREKRFQMIAGSPWGKVGQQDFNVDAARQLNGPEVVVVQVAIPEN